MELKNFFAQDAQGNIIPSPTVYLYQPGTTTLAIGLKDAAGAPLANPFTGTAEGQIVLAAPDGEYDLRVSGAGRDLTMRVQFIDLQTQVDLAQQYADDAANSANEALSVASMVRSVSDRTALKALSTTYPAYLTEADRRGTYRYDATVPIATHQGDATEYWYVAPNAAANGAWVRQGAAGLPSLVRSNDVRTLSGMVKGAANSVDVVSELSDPTLAKNAGRRVLLMGQPPVWAYCDGAKWWDLTNGTEISPWWLPRGAVLWADFDNSRFYWDGAVKALSDLTSSPTGGYSLNTGFGFAGTAWVLAEYSQTNETADVTGTLWSWTSGYPSGNRVEMVHADNATYGNNFRLYVSPGTPSADFDAAGAAQSKTGEGGAFWHFTERHKLLARVKSGTLNRFQSDNGEIRNGLKTAGTLATPTKLGLACRAWASTNPDYPLTNGTLHRLGIWTQDLSPEHLKAIGRTGAAQPIHLLGDSFLNNYQVFARLGQKLSTAGIRASLSQDGVGGTTLTQQAARYAAYTGDQQKWWNSTLVICDFGQETDAQESIEAIKTMLKYIRHDRWIYMQAAPSSGFSPVAPLQPKDAIMKAWCGEHFVSTLPEAWAKSDGSPTDLAQIAVGRWPASLTLSTTDFHPNVAGCVFLGELIYNALNSRGWL